MNRQDKIKLLKSIQSGTMNVSDLQPKNLLIKCGYPKHIHSTFIDGKPVSAAQYQEELHRQIKYAESRGEYLKTNFSYGPEVPV